MRKPTSKFFRPTFEALADRIVPTVALVNGDIVITGRDTPVLAPFAKVGGVGSVFDDADVATVDPVYKVVKFGREPFVFIRSVLTAYRVVDNGTTTDIPAGQVTGGNVVFNGLGGNDRFTNNTGLGAVADGGPGSDALVGGAGSDALVGGAGNDTLRGGDGHDSMDGQAGNDYLVGGAGNDGMNGGDGDDIVLGDGGNDIVTAGAGNDYVVGGDGDDILSGDGGDDTLDGWTGNDRLDGGDGADTLWGRSGDDTLYGGRGVDRLSGGDGNDGLFAGVGDGKETLEGGAGADRFLIPANTSGTQEDTISDKTSADAKVVFRDSPALTGKKFTGQSGTHSFQAGFWDNGQVERVDVALANLHRHVGNTKLLKTAGGSEMSFLAVGPQTSSGFQAGGWNEGTRIAFVDLPNISTTYLQRTVYHEFGHNWDSTSENSHASAFRAVSGWVEWPGGPFFPNTPPASFGLTASSGVGDRWYYLTSAAGTFARNYGKTNPFEDMATTWEAYFVNAYHGGATGLASEGLTKSQDKWDTLDDLFIDLRS